MPNHSPMFHMDEDYNWRWYIVDSYGNLICISAESFFEFDEAKQDYELACLIMKQAA